MRPDLLAYPVDRIADQRLRGLLVALVEGMKTTNDPETLRALGQSLKLLGDMARSEAWMMDKSRW